jgi:hypothetical protein
MKRQLGTKDCVRAKQSQRPHPLEPAVWAAMCPGPESRNEVPLGELDTDAVHDGLFDTPTD